VRKYKLLANDCGDFWVLYSKYNTTATSHLRGLIIEKNKGPFKIIAAPFCTTTFSYNDPKLTKIIQRCDEAFEPITENNIIVRMFNYNGKWKFATKQNANFEKWKETIDFKTEIFDQILGYDSATLNLDPQNTYVFAVKSSKIYPGNEDKIYHITTYSNVTLEEIASEPIANTHPQTPITLDKDAILAGNQDAVLKTPTCYIVVYSKDTLYKRASTDRHFLLRILINKQGIPLLQAFPEYRDIVDKANRDIEAYVKYNLEKRASNKNPKLHSYIKVFHTLMQKNNALDTLNILCRDYMESYVFNDMEKVLENCDSIPTDRLIFA